MKTVYSYMSLLKFILMDQIYFLCSTRQCLELKPHGTQLMRDWIPSLSLVPTISITGSEKINIF